MRGLGVDPALDRVPAQVDLLLRKRERLASGDQNLLADDVDAADHLGHAVLDLDPGVHLEEEVIVADLQSLDRAGRAVADRGGGVGGDLADPLAHLGVDVRARRLLDHLLVTALDRAVALAEVDHAALRVGQYLDLDVTRVPVVGGHRDAEALAAATARGLAGDRVAGVLGLFARLVKVLRRRRRARHDRHPGLGHDLPRAGLRPHRLDRLWRRADEDDPRLGAGAGEIGVLGEEAIAGMDRLRPGLPGRVDDLLDVEVALSGSSRAEQKRLVGLPYVRCVPVDLGVDRHRVDPHLLKSPGHPNGYLSPIGYQHLLEHGGAVYLCERRGGEPGTPPRSTFL